jgi:hypothetical protein
MGPELYIEALKGGADIVLGDSDHGYRPTYTNLIKIDTDPDKFLNGAVGTAVGVKLPEVVRALRVIGGPVDEQADLGVDMRGRRNAELGAQRGSDIRSGGAAGI